MRFAITLMLVACATLAIFNSNLFAKTISASDLQHTKQGNNQNSPCLINLNAGLTRCEQTGKALQQMVLIRGQLLLVEKSGHGT